MTDPTPLRKFLHDIRNALGVGLGQGRLLAKGLDQGSATPEVVKAKVAKVLTAMERIEDLVHAIEKETEQPKGGPG